MKETIFNLTGAILLIAFPCVLISIMAKMESK